MAEDTEIISKNEDRKKSCNLFSLLANLRLNLSPPLIKQEKKAADDGEEEDERITGKKTDVVKFSDPKPLAPPPLKVEVEESDHNPAARWLVYAFGGFLVLRWVWARWQERRERARKKEPSDNNESNYESPADEDHGYHSA